MSYVQQMHAEFLQMWGLHQALEMPDVTYILVDTLLTPILKVRASGAYCHVVVSGRLPELHGDLCAQLCQHGHLLKCAMRMPCTAVPFS